SRATTNGRAEPGNTRASKGAIRGVPLRSQRPRRAMACSKANGSCPSAVRLVLWLSYTSPLLGAYLLQPLDEYGRTNDEAVPCSHEAGWGVMLVTALGDKVVYPLAKSSPSGRTTSGGPMLWSHMYS